MELFPEEDTDQRHLWRMEKPPPSPIRAYAPGPEDDDDFVTDSDIQSHKQHDNSNSSNNNAEHTHYATTAPAPGGVNAPTAVNSQQSPPPLPALSRPRGPLYPSLGLSREHTSSSSSRSVDQREIRSESSRHGYSAISANPAGTMHHGNITRTSSSSGSGGGGVGERQSVLTRLLSSPSLLSQPPTRATTTPTQDFWRAVTTSAAGYGSSSNSQGRRHSILRFGSSRRPKSERGMKKSASVEFKLHEEAHLKHSSSDTKYYSGNMLGREMPRRLTEEEKEELYRIRPDLEIGPTPFFKEQMEELNRRSQKRVLFAMFGGLISIVLLLVFYALLARG